MFILIVGSHTHRHTTSYSNNVSFTVASVKQDHRNYGVMIMHLLMPISIDINICSHVPEHPRTNVSSTLSLSSYKTSSKILGLLRRLMSQVIIHEGALDILPLIITKILYIKHLFSVFTLRGKNNCYILRGYVLMNSRGIKCLSYINKYNNNFLILRNKKFINVLCFIRLIFLENERRPKCFVWFCFSSAKVESTSYTM